MSLPRYPEYKDSRVEWLRDVPTHWTVMPIRLAARLESGHTPSRSRPDWWEDCSVPWFTLADVSQIRRGGADVIYDTKEKVSELGLQNSSARRLPAGTVMLSRTASVGFSAIMGVEMATTQDFANWVCSSSLRPRFLLHVFRAMRGEFARLMMGSTHNTIYMPDIAALRFALPPVEEQDAVVSFLDRETAKIDSLIAKQEKLIALLAEKRQATISHAVTKGLNPDAPMKDSGVAWLGEVPAHWETGCLKRFAEVIDCKHHTVQFLDEGLPIVSIRELRNNRVDLSDAKLTSPDEWNFLREGRTPQCGDLIFCRNASVGAVGYVGSDERPFCMGQDVCIIRPQARGRFMHYQLTGLAVQNQIEALLVGATIRRANVEEIRGLLVTWPPADEQAAIADFLERETARLDALTTEATRAIALLQERRSALISSAVTGQIDIRQAVTC